MKNYLFYKCFIALSFILFVSALSFGQSLNPQSFKAPAKEFYPKTWMHAMSGNMSKEGMTKDLQAMADVGLSGLLFFNVTQGIPYGNVKYASSEHLDIIKHAAKEAERLGLSFGVHNCDGWSSSGGPWITPEQSMKMMVWSETIVKGGKENIIKMPQPTTREGLYKDIAVLAYPSLSAEIENLNEAIVSSSDTKFNIQIATDKKWDKESFLFAKDKENPWIQFDYKQPQTIRSASIIFNDREGAAEIYTSDNGKDFKLSQKLNKYRTGKGEWVLTAHFQPVKARYFRLVFNAQITIKEASLSAVYTVNDPFGRTAIARTEHADFKSIGNPDDSMIINKNSIINLSPYLDASGSLKADLPKGTWTIMRFGYTSTGAFNNPASKEGKGLEVDKLNRADFKVHYDAFVKKVVEAAKPVAPNALQYVEIDSYEMGGQNWTTQLDSIFKSQKGYNIIDFLPLVAGKFVESAKSSALVLGDYRDVISNLMTENYFGYFQELCHKDGLKTYIENYGFGPLNDLDIGAKADLPMGEFWMNRPITQVQSPISAAHIYGRNIISAESFTSTPEINWKANPAMAKISGDKAWALGINEFMFHRYAHQANTHVEPGMTMNRWGFHMDRTQTWWYNAGKAWFTYVARGSYLLRQGVPVADLLVFIGDGSPNSTVGRKDFKQPIPAGINFDCVNADVLLNRITVKNKELVLPEGTTYKALVIKNSEQISLRTLKRIYELAQAGVPIIGEQPKELIGYLQTKNDLAEFKNLIDEIWNKTTGYKDYNWQQILPMNNITADFAIEGRDDINFMHRKSGEGDIYFTYNPDSVAQTFNIRFKQINKIPELWNPLTGEVTKTAVFKHDGGYTTVSVALNAEESVFVIFREPSKTVVAIQAEPSNHETEYQLGRENQIQVVLSKNGSYSTTLSTGKAVKIKVKDIPEAMVITGNWKVEFNKQQGFGGTVDFNTLIDWKDHPKDSIKYYSGTAVYKKSITITSKSIQKDHKIYLDLGRVNIVATIKINGKDLGVSWMPPFVVDITDAVKPGENQLEIAVTNQWSNRLIGDERYPKQDGGYKLESYNPTGIMPEWYVNNLPMPAGPRTTFTTAPFYKATDPLMSSGLLGPVKIVFNKIVTIGETKTNN